MTRMQILAAILLLLAVVSCLAGDAKAQTTPSAALAGRVSSQQEGPMEGVLVSAKKANSNITITVVSDSQGRYSFPRNRLETGEYSLTIRAAGFEMDPAKAEVTSSKTAAADLKLRKAEDLASQLTNTEWLLSAPGTEEQKRPLAECSHCHTLERIFRSHYNAADLEKTAARMSTYYEGTQPERPQLQKPQPKVRYQFISAKDAEYLSTLNLSSASQWQYPLKTLPRPRGKATRVIVTQYDLPRQYAMAHDVVPDMEGNVWYSDHGQQYLGRLDPKTGKVVEYPVPVLRPGYPAGLHFLQLDPEGNIWLSMGAQAGVAKFDRKTQKFQTWSMPTGGGRDDNPSAYPLLLPYQSVDGKVWVGEFTTKRLERLDVRSGEWEQEPIDPFRDISKNSARRHSFYDMFADSQKNVYLTDITSELIGKLDVKTKQMTFYPTPTPNSGPRRGHMDKQDRLWFGENRGDRIAMFDTKTERFQEWKLPTPFSAPYDAVLDKNGYAWTAGMTSDRVARLNTATGEIIEYLLPRSTNIRRVEVDNSTGPPAFWTGDNHGASIVKLEPLE
jgi:streptogramin lyase